MSGGDIKNFFRPSFNNSSPQRGKKRPWELPIAEPFSGAFPLAEPIPSTTAIVQPCRAKRSKGTAVNPILRVRHKLEIMQWHFSQKTPNCVVTAKKFFPDQPVKVRSIQNWAKKGLNFWTKLVSNGGTGTRVSEGKGGLLPLLDQKVDII